MIFLFIIALIGFAIACPGITIFLFWLFTRPLVIGAIIIFVVISVIATCVTENKHEEKSASDGVFPQEKGDWYIHYLSQPQEEQDENDVDGLHKENTSLDNPSPDIYREKETWHIQSLSKQQAKNKKNDREANMALFSWLKYDKEGYDKNGFDRDGYNRSGYDKDGYNREGFNQAGFDYYGYDKYGFDKNGYNAEGYNRQGYDRNGYSSRGFDKYGYDRDGYDKSGFNAEGYNRAGFDAYGFDRAGFNREGYDRSGFNHQGFNKEGYDRKGFNDQGFNREGYDHEGFNDQGFDKDGYDKNGCDLNGFDRLGRASCPECHGKIPKRQYKFCPECGCPIIYVKRSGKGQENAAAAPKIEQTEIPTEKEDLLEIFSEYERLIILDTETSGLDADRHQIIELAFVELKRDEYFKTVRTYDKFIKLYNEGQKLDAKIVELTGITSEVLEENGITRTEAVEEIAEIFSAERTLVFAYNAQFDIHFLANFLKGSDGEKCIKAWDYLDVLTVYKDRRPYPHKLRNAISAYHLENEVANTHRAIDDVQATLAVLKAMIQEKPDVFRYVNLFGFNPKWGISGRRIEKIRYVAQPYNQRKKLYEVGI